MTTTVKQLVDKWINFYLHNMTSNNRVPTDKAIIYIQDAVNAVYTELPILRVREEMEPQSIEGNENEKMLVFPAFTFVKIMQIQDAENDRVPINLMNNALVNAIRPITFATYLIPEEYSYIEVFKAEYQAKPDWSEGIIDDVLEIPLNVIELILLKASYEYYSRFTIKSENYRKSNEFYQKYSLMLNQIKRSNVLGTNKTYRAVGAANLGLP